MREIKFRAFDKKRKCMFQVTEINFRANGNIYSVSPDQGGTWLLIDEVELLQYTGLKDKNGREVYEGDLLKKVLTIDVTALGEKSAEIETHEIIGYVKFEKGHFGIYFIKHTSHKEAENSFYPFLNEKEYEIIGNIFENSELLEKKQ